MSTLQVDKVMSLTGGAPEIPHNATTVEDELNALRSQGDGNSSQVSQNTQDIADNQALGESNRERIETLEALANSTQYLSDYNKSLCIAAAPLKFADPSYQPRDVNFEEDDVLKASSANSGCFLTGITDGGVSGTERYFDLQLPYMVVIGDSISEGHPALHGRLHPNGVPSYDPNYKSQTGQISWELGHRFNMPTVNQGIGGQTSAQIRNRWNRDVLAQVYNVGDYLPNDTLNDYANGRIPHAVYLHIGVNDASLGADLETYKDNMRFFAQSCLDNNIIPLFANIGAWSAANATQKQWVDDANAWLGGDFKTEYPNVILVDYLDWSTNGTGNIYDLKSGMFADTVHPNITGYQDYGRYITRTVSAPVYMTHIQMGTGLSGPSQANRSTSWSVRGGKSTFEATETLQQVALPINATDTDILYDRFTVLSDEIVTDATAGDNQYVGIASCRGVFATRKPDQYGGSPLGTGMSIVATGTFINGVLNLSWPAINCATTDFDWDDITGTGTLTLDVPANFLMLQQIGGDSFSGFDKRIRWGSGVTNPNGTTSFQIYMENTSGVSAAKTYVTFTFMAVATPSIA